MLRRFAPLMLLVTVASIAPLAQAHQCLTVRGSYALDLSLVDGTTITIVEESPVSLVFLSVPTEICADGVEEDAQDGALIISRDGEELCRNDDADPSFDPFAFGGGIHTMETEDACAADFSAASIPNPLLPDAETTNVGIPTTIGTTRDVITDTEGAYRIGDETFVIPQDTTGVSKRQYVIDGEL